ncbi:hypothetical protein NP493_108g02032, partial [Ridgeia piscesae]
FLWPWYCLPFVSILKYPLYRFLLIGLAFVIVIFIVGIMIIGSQPLGQRSHISLPTVPKPNPAIQKVSVAVATDVKDPSLHYGVVVDLGSSGSRVFVYFWPPHDGATSELLNIQQMRGRDADPVVKKITPEKTQGDTPVLDGYSSDQEAILNSLRVDIPMKFDFLFAKTHAEVISGRQEGVYLWIAINHALGKFDHTLGDMGGASLQIAYEVPDASAALDSQLTKFNLGCSNSDIQHTYSIYVTTFLGYGGNTARTRYEHMLIEQHVQSQMVPTNDTVTSNTLPSSTKNVISDPCLTVNKVEHVTYGGQQFDLKGTGNYLLCQQSLVPLLNKSVTCQKQPCSMNGVYQPEIKFQRSTFFGFSEFYYSSEDVLRLGGAYHYETFERAAKVKWRTLETWHRKKYYPKATRHRLKTECFKAAWMTTVLHKGLGFPKTYQRLTTTQLLYGREVQWTLGAILYKTRFYPLRYMKTENQQHAHVYQFSGIHQVTSALLLSCFGVVMAAILVFVWQLHVSRRVSLRRVPTMSYFMTDPNQAEEGILVQDTNYYYP